MRRGSLVGVIAALALGFVLPAGPAAAAETDPDPDRFTLAGGCYSLGSSGQVGDGLSQLRMQATDLGSYLLYRPDQSFVAARSDGSVGADQLASPAADWAVTATGDGFSLSPLFDRTRALRIASGGALALAAPGSSGTQLEFKPAQGCPLYPEAELNASGRPKPGATQYGTVGGLLEGHMHWMTFEYFGGEFHCGRPWHRYGIPYALPDCAGIEGPQGTAAAFQNFLNYGNPAQPHDTTGWPKLTEWRNTNLTYEGTYWRWIQRAWLSGLRLMVMSVNENRVLCELQPRKSRGCNEMDTVRQGFADVRELERYVDAQAGGPGKGFFEIVTDPYQARRVINQGRMAVVLEVEISELFDCRGLEGQSSCDVNSVNRSLDELYDLGVRSSLLLNKFDNPLTGVRFDSGAIGTVINGANRQSSGSFWSAKTCENPKLSDNTIETVPPEASGTFTAILTLLGVPGGTVPAYPPAPHCNTRGLTDLGRHVVQQMMKRGMIVNPDHMSQKSVDATLDIAEANDYSGVISPHGWTDPGNWPRFYKLGGMAFPDSETSSRYVELYDTYRPRQTPFKLGWGYGADLGGLAEQPAAPDPSKSITYPFKSYDGDITFERQRTGDRTFDYAKEGIAHYGLYTDWFEDLQENGGNRLAADMWKGAENYLQMWERANGIASPGCATAGARVSKKGLRGIRLRAKWEGLLRRAGQPQTRSRAWVYCVRGKRNKRAADVAVLSAAGKVELAGSTARGRRAGGIGVGAKALVLRAKGARKAGKGVFTRPAGKRAVYVYSVRKGRVGAVAVATRGLATKPKQLRRAMKMVSKARGDQTPQAFVDNPNAANGRVTGTTLAGASNPRLNRALRLYCKLPGRAL